MVKFLHSRKGFSLVELMIVVVIMAILVAVAVPIYNAVTDNAKKGTCIDNQRQIMSIIGNDFILLGKTAKGPLDATFLTIYADTTLEGAGGKNYVVDGTYSAEYGVTEEKLKQLFQTVPCCGADVGVITVKFYAVGAGDTIQIVPSCTLASEGHVVTD